MRSIARLALTLAALTLPAFRLPASADPTVTVIQDVAYRTVDGVTLRLDVYRPDSPGPFPAVLVVHGGRWEKGDKREWAADADTLARGGFVAFVADYRLDCDPAQPPPGVDPELCGNHAPAPVNDLAAAMRWVRANAAAYGADPASVGALGGSAGGNLALMLATRGIPAGDRPEAVVSWSGNTELWRYDLARNPPNAEAIAERYVGCPYEGTGACPVRWTAASPITHVTPGDSPTYLANSMAELIPVKEARHMAAALDAAGVQHVLRLLPGSLHERAYEDVEVSPGVTVFEESMGFLHDHLG
jgi:acetyl esterase/lipase